MGPDVLMQDGIITHRFIVAQDDKYNGSLETGKKALALPKLAAKFSDGSISETVECTDCHRCLGGGGH